MLSGVSFPGKKGKDKLWDFATRFPAPQGVPMILEGLEGHTAKVNAPKGWEMSQRAMVSPGGVPSPLGIVEKPPKSASN